MQKNIHILEEKGWADYALLDSGDLRKLERFGDIIVDRPEPQALWNKTLPEKDWKRASARFDNASDREEDDKGSWHLNQRVPESWSIGVDGVRMNCRLMTFRHMGLFPEQRPHWQFMSNKIRSAGRPVKLLNLFGYTGAASLLAAKAGAQVTHLDASKKAIRWARDNQADSGLDQAPIRWICDDAGAFVARELRRGSQYDAILLDPPKYGRGPEGEIWRFETDIADFLASCAQLLSDKPLFMLVTAYALRFSSLSLGNLLGQALDGKGATIQSGELTLVPESGHNPMSTSLFALGEF